MTTAAWHTRRTVRFAQCDPAGIVFYPRFFEIVHEAKEEFFAVALGQPYPVLLREMRRGLPIVRLEADFLAPSRHGDELDIRISVGRVGRSSVELDYALSCGDERRLQVHSVIVHTDLGTGHALAIDARLRAALTRFSASSGPSA